MQYLLKLLCDNAINPMLNERLDSFLYVELANQHGQEKRSGKCNIFIGISKVQASREQRPESEQVFQ